MPCTSIGDNAIGENLLSIKSLFEKLKLFVIDIHEPLHHGLSQSCSVGYEAAI